MSMRSSTRRFAQNDGPWNQFETSLKPVWNSLKPAFWNQSETRFRGLAESHQVPCLPREAAAASSAQTLYRESPSAAPATGDASSIFPANFHTKWLLWHVHVHFDCAGSHKTAVAAVASGIFLVNFHAAGCLWHVHVHFGCAGSHETGVAVLVSCIFPYTLGFVACPCAFRLPRDLLSYRDLVQRSCQDASSGDLVQRHCIEICCRDLAKRSLT